MKRGVSVTVNGEAMSLRKACDVLGLCHSSVAWRLKRGKTLEEAFDVGPRGSGGKYFVEVDGQQVSLGEACRELGLSFTTAMTRLKKGLDWREKGRPFRGGTAPIKYVVELDGRTMSLAEACRALRLPYGTAKQRVISGRDWRTGMKKTYTVVRQDWEESERGWGTRPDGYTLHLTMEDHKAFVDGYYAAFNNAASVPDEYTRTCGSAKPMDVDHATYKELETARKSASRDPRYDFHKRGIWRR